MKTSLRLLLALAAATLSAFTPGLRAQSTATVTALYNFRNATDGADPQAALIQGSDGNFYGTTYKGGSSHVGTIFSLTPQGGFTTLHGFSGSEGAYPLASLVQGSDGNFYGTTQGGGSGGYGAIFSLTPSGALTTLHSFSTPDGDGSNNDGADPQAALIQGSDGNFYGTASEGGEVNSGTIFSISPAGSFTTRKLFGDGVGAGSGPTASLIQGSDGNFYGTTYSDDVGQDGPEGNGTVFSLTPKGGFTTLHDFGADEGAQPLAPLVQGSDGNFYGTTEYGGDGYGTIFSMTPSGALTTLYSFGGADGDGADPAAGLVEGSDGTFYGTTPYGGSNGTGTVFAFTVTGIAPPSISLTTLYSFTAVDSKGHNADGAHPEAALLQGADGYLYGTASGGGSGGDGTVFKLILPPVITSPTSAAAYAGSPFSYQITATGDPTSYGATGLPAGLTVNTATGLISGTPTATGNSSVFVSATNAAGTGSRSVLLFVQQPPPAPAITSSLTASGQTGTAFSYQIAASNSPTSYGAANLPAGLSVNSSTGIISGTPKVEAGTYSVTISANNAGGTGSATLTVTIQLGAPIINSAATATATQDQAFSYQIAATGSPTSFAASGLPTGLTVNTSTGLITGSPRNTGKAAVTLDATNSVGTGSARLTITIQTPPVITSATTATANVGSAFSYQIAATNNPTSYAASGLPTGLSINTATGLISGSPKNVGKAAVTISATNAAGTGTAKVTITITALPAITSATTASANVGSVFSYQITATNSPNSYAAPGLPTGLTLNATTGLISGTPKDAGKATVTIGATNAAGTGTAKLTITITALPVITSATTASATVGDAFSYPITATNKPTSYAASGLPTGLSVNTSTGLITGTPKNAGKAAVTISATNAVGTGTAKVTITIAAP